MEFMTGLLTTLVLVFSIDRGTKALAFRWPGPGGRRSVFGSFVIRPVRNPQPSIWPGGGPLAWSFAIGVAGIAVGCALWLDPGASEAVGIGAGAALGGATGNLYDRLRHGAVLDFLDLGRGGVFNPADAALVTGISIVLLSQFTRMASS